MATTARSEFDIPAEISEVEKREGCSTFWLQGGKFPLFCRHYSAKTSTPPKGTIFILHGYSEHAGRYAHLAQFFTRAQYEVFSLDFPGLGRSGGLRSDILSFNDYVHSAELLVAEAQKRKSAQPFHLFAHSMGGLVAIRFAETSYLSTQIRTLSLSSPLLGLANFSVSTLPYLNLLCGILPNILIPNSGELGTRVLTHDEEMIRTREADPMIKSCVRPHWVRAFVKARTEAFRDIRLFQTPTTFFLAGDDKVVSRPEAERFYKLASGVKKIHVYEGLLHEIVNELERDKIMQDILTWIDSGGSILGG